MSNDFYCSNYNLNESRCFIQCGACKAWKNDMKSDQPIPVDNTEFLKKVNAGLATWTGKDAKPVEQESKPDKLTFNEFVSKEHDGSIEWVNDFIVSCIKSKVHYGDCTKSAQSCLLCQIEELLCEYRRYFFDKPKLQPEQQDWKGKLFHLLGTYRLYPSPQNYGLIEGFIDSLISPLQAENEKLREQIKLFQK